MNISELIKNSMIMVVPFIVVTAIEVDRFNTADHSTVTSQCEKDVMEDVFLYHLAEYIEDRCGYHDFLKLADLDSFFVSIGEELCEFADPAFEIRYFLDNEWHIYEFDDVKTRKYIENLIE